MSNKQEYEPFGEEWAKEMKKVPKPIIIDMLSRANTTSRIITKDCNVRIEELKDALRFFCSNEHIEQDAYEAKIKRCIKDFNL